MNWDLLSVTLFNCFLSSQGKPHVGCQQGLPACLKVELNDNDFRNYAVFFASIKPLCGYLVSRNRSISYWFQFYSKDIKDQFSSFRNHFSIWKNNVLYKCFASQFFPFYDYEPEFSQSHYIPHIVSIILAILFESQRGFSIAIIQFLFEFIYSSFISDAPIIGTLLYYTFFDYYTMAIVSRYLFFLFAWGKDFFVFLFAMGRLVLKATEKLFKTVAINRGNNARCRRTQLKPEMNAAWKTFLLVILTLTLNFVFHFYLSKMDH